MGHPVSMCGIREGVLVITILCMTVVAVVVCVHAWEGAGVPEEVGGRGGVQSPHYAVC